MTQRKPTGDAMALSRRERQIMDIVYRRGKATIHEVRDDLPDPPSYSAVRALMRVLEDKGQLRHSQAGPRYVYEPTVARDHAARSALTRLIDTFFAGSATDTFATLLKLGDRAPSTEELDELEAMIAAARASDEGRG